jgi:hypothetical protein
MPGDSAGEQFPILDKGFDHAWQWFSLHASHRMQGVNFFLVASAFLSTAYVSALHFALPIVAAGVGLLGMVFSICFYLLEMRIRGLVKAGERALIPVQRKLAELTNVPEFMICDFVEKPKHSYAKYSVVIRTLYWSTAAEFLVGIVYASHSFSTVPHELQALVLYRCVVVLAAVASLYWGQNLIARERGALNWFQCAVGLVLVTLGAFVLVVSAVRQLR